MRLPDGRELAPGLEPKYWSDIPEQPLVHPLFEQILISQPKVLQAISKMAEAMVVAYKDEWPRPFFVAPLNGGAGFGTRLTQEITRLCPNFFPDLYFTYITTYGKDRLVGPPKTILDITTTLELRGTTLKGRRGIITEDVLTSGETALHQKDRLIELGAAIVELAVIAEKEDPDRIAYPHAEWRAFVVPKDWLTGATGLDDARYIDANGIRIPEVNRHALYVAKANPLSEYEQ